MKLLLAYISGQPDRRDPYISLLPTGLCYLQSYLREEGHDAWLANFSGWSERDIQSRLKAVKPVVVGISQWTHNRHESLQLARQVRQMLPQCLIVMGGGHATFRWREMLSVDNTLDAIVVGEGEATMLELADCIAKGVPWQNIPGIACRRNGKAQLNNSRPPLSELDRVPFAARYLHQSVGVDCQLQAEFIVTARGCPSACTFCSSPAFWGRKVRFRSPRNVVDEIMFLRDRYGLIYFSLRDDTFSADRRRTMEICRLLIEGGAGIVWNCQSRVTTLDEELLVMMKRAGCECIQLGVESGSAAILSMLDKAITPPQVERAAALIRKVGIHLSVYLISDVPGESDLDIAETAALMERIRPDDGYVSPLAYYPGTRLLAKAIKDGRVSEDVFETSRSQAIYAAQRRGRGSRRLLTALQGGGTQSRKSVARIKRELGFCHVTNVTFGEWLRQGGDYRGAEREFREITELEPGNPWGWYLLAELYAEMAEQEVARECYRKVLRIVPGHGPSLAAVKNI